MTSTSDATRRACLRKPIPEIDIAAKLLDAAVTAHLRGEDDRARGLIGQANMPVVREWGESLWGKNSPYIPRHKKMIGPLSLPKEQRIPPRMADSTLKQQLIARDGFHCRFCGIPVIRLEIRNRFRKFYPDQPIWGTKNWEQHAALQTMWLQYDHIVPHSRGGQTTLENMVITCGPCNFGRMEYTLEEVGLTDPRERAPAISNWDGLERLRQMSR
jgi:hypothetical protein